MTDTTEPTGWRLRAAARAQAASARTFSAFSERNYRLWFLGQGISLTGTWMQTVAQGLLVLELTGSGTELGLVTAPRRCRSCFCRPGAASSPTASPSGRPSTSPRPRPAPGPDARRARGQRRDPGLDGLPSGRRPRTRQGGRHADAPVVRAGDGRQRDAGQRRLPQLDPGQPGPRNRPDHRRRPDRHRRHGRLFVLNGISYFGVLATLAAMRAGELRSSPLADRTRGQIRQGWDTCARRRSCAPSC